MEALMTRAEVAKLLGIEEVTLDLWRKEGRAPQALRFSQKCVRWEPAAVRVWLEEHREPARA